MKLIIVESPTKSRTLQSFLGKEYKVLSSFGHVRDLPKSNLGVDTEHDFEPSYIIPAKARKTVSALKKEMGRADSVILATDEDREGESIAWHLMQALGLKDPDRIVFHEITKSAIEEALRNPRKIDRDLVDAQQARRVLDRLVGYKLSPFLWKKVARKLSAGRVQSAAVRLLVDREREIEAFKAEEYWQIIAKFFKHTEFEATLAQKDGKPVGKLDIKTEKEAKDILKDLEGAEYRVAAIEKKETRKNPLPPFTTSTLQQTASQRFHFPASFTMRLAQQLYETGLITYHRTDSLNLAQSALEAAKDFIVKEYGQSYWTGAFHQFKTKSKGAQEAHEAIRPTNLNFMPRNPDALVGTPTSKGASGLTPPQQKLYTLIWQRFLASQMSQAVFDATTVDVGAQKYVFRANGQMLKFDGFLKVYPMKFQETDLPSLTKDDLLLLKELTPSQHFTEPPPRYNEASLIKALEGHGIGRPSTYAPILSTIQERNYVEKDEQRRLRPTEIGKTVNDLLVKHFPRIVDIEFTAQMESDLDEIAENKKEWVPMIKEFYEPFEKNLEKKYEEVPTQKVAVETTDKPCPECGKMLVIRFGRFGKFYACSTFPTCTYTESLETKNAPIGMACPKCGNAASEGGEPRPAGRGEVVMKRTRKGRMFYGCNRYPACDFATWQKPKNEVE